ncbi:hypothetical protein EJV46_19925 [Roseococcus sp. SYP-B2431]|uniref:hypothetical protein n=1 Tax=Roseococcus sp. SYP-B2431 TaxID=2496640 RepID=UPI00103E8C8B|nr:hypothetical protein [Roseococcus sp. SYP-B2431]TCH96839.1 hypothetical protein EJV46_19925 [Roseococcus sp. SYP-B2431]
MPRWVLLLPLLLAACATGPDREVEAARAALASHRASLEALGVPPSAPSAAPLPPRVPGRMAGPAAARRPAPAPRMASALLGASPAAVRAALGEPILRREEGPAEVWLYAGGGCQLDIVMYPSEAGPRVAHVQARAGGLAQRTEASCLRDLAAQGASHQAPSDENAAPLELGA